MYRIGIGNQFPVIGEIELPDDYSKNESIMNWNAYCQCHYQEQWTSHYANTPRSEW